MSYEELADVFDKINDIVLGSVSDEEMGEIYRIEAEALKAVTVK